VKSRVQPGDCMVLGVCRHLLCLDLQATESASDVLCVRSVWGYYRHLWFHNGRIFALTVRSARVPPIALGLGDLHQIIDESRSIV
jgi:hypothetical protein